MLARRYVPVGQAVFEGPEARRLRIEVARAVVGNNRLSAGDKITVVPSIISSSLRNAGEIFSLFSAARVRASLLKSCRHISIFRRRHDAKMGLEYGGIYRKTEADSRINIEACI